MAVRIQPQLKRINPIVKDPIGNGLIDRASDALLKRRGGGIPATKVIPNGAKLGTLMGGAPDLQ